MPPISAELQLFLNTLQEQVRRVQDSEDVLSQRFVKFLDDDRKTLSLYVTQDQLKEAQRLVNEDIDTLHGSLTEVKNDLKQIREVDLKAVQDAIIENQKSSLRRIIGVQAAVLVSIPAIIALLYQILPSLLHR